MEDNQQIPVSEVDTTKLVKGKVKIFGNINNPTPTILARSTKALRYFSVFLIGTVSGSDYFSGEQSKAICFGLSVFIGFLGAVDVFVGVEPEKRNTVMGLLVVLSMYLLAVA
jgi:hypothetical protein